MIDSQLERLSKRVRQLTWAVVALAILCGLELIAIGKLAALKSPTIEQMAVLADAAESSAAKPNPYEEFFEWPLERQLREASVIAVIRYVRESGRVRCVVEEILKHDPAVEFFYEAGQDYERCWASSDDSSDGMVWYFAGSPADAIYGTSFKGDRITAHGGMPIAELRRRAAASAVGRSP